MDSILFKMDSGKLDIILGCMFSGKTTELQNRIRKMSTIYNNIIVINHSSDNRYNKDGSVCSHNKIFINSLSCNKLKELYDLDEYKNSKMIFIDEGQFFEDLEDFVKIAVDKEEKWVTISGLDGDINRKEFGKMLQIIPLADSVTKMKAFCKICANGIEAIFTAKIESTQKNIVDIGGSDKYIPLCRRHYLEHYK